MTKMRLALKITLLLLAIQGCIGGGGPMREKEPVSVYRGVRADRPPRTVMVAHRCGANLGPENTRAAVVQSSFYRPDFYEIDIRHTKDGVAVCLHDETLDRTTDLSGPVSELTFDQIENTDAGAWVSPTFSGERIPTFEQMVNSVNPSALAIELKEPDITMEQCRSMLEILNKKNDISSVVMSFHLSALESWREAERLSPRKFPTRTVLLTTKLDDTALNGQQDVVGILKDACSEEVVEAVHEAGKAVWVWTVNDDFFSFLEMKVDGIVTDSPDRLRKILPPG